MRKFIPLIFILLFSITAGFAQNGRILLNSQENGINITNNNYEKLELTVSHNQINSFTVNTKSGTFDEISIPGARFTGQIGEPKLPAYSKLIEVPFGAEFEVVVKNYTVEEYKLSDFGINNSIIPAQPDVRKDQDPEKVKFHYNEKAYNSDVEFIHQIANVNAIGVMRGVRIAKLAISPVAYNIENGTIKVFNNIEIEIIFKNADIQLTEYNKQANYSPYFESVYNKLLNHKNVIDDHPDLTKYPVKMLILSDRMFEDALQPYILWKTMKGFEVIVNYTDEGYSSVAEIKTWIQTHYDAGTPEDPAPSFCLFVGDVAQIPASQTGVNSGKMTDLYYFSQDGDYFPEMYYGRFSANNLTELQPQIDKTLYHERYEFEDPTYLDDVTLIAGADGSWNPAVGQPTVQYGTENYFNVAHGFVNINAYLSEYSGCYDNERISVSLINYTAHCSETVWGTPALSISDIDNMTNTNKYPLAVGNCCLSADFNTLECIGEAWVRAENKGAVAYIGSSPSSYWFEDFYWAVGAFPIVGNNDGYVPTVEETTLGVYDAMFISDYVTVDATVFLGNLVVTEVDVEGYPQHADPLYYWEAYNCLGDPSLVTFRTQAELNNVSHLPTLPIGMAFFEVTAEPGSYVGISKDGILHGAALIDETGTVQVPIIPVTSGGDVDIVITKPQYQPYMVTVPAAALDGPYMVINSYVDEVNFGQTVDLDLVLENVGTETAIGVNVTASVADPYATLINPNYSYGDINSETVSAPSSGAFTLEVSDEIEDGYMVAVTFEITDAEDTWTYTKTVTVNAPEITINDLSIVNDDNTDGILAPGETADLLISVTNTGNADVTNIISVISTLATELTINIDTDNTTPLLVGETYTCTFNVTADAGTPLGTEVFITNDVTAGETDFYTAQKEFSIIIGFIPVYCESSANYDGDTEIQEVYFGDVENNTAGECAMYSDFTDNEDLTAEFVIGSTNNYIAFYLGNCDAGSFTKAGKIYIDWNYDGDFEDEGEMIHESIAQNNNWLSESSFTVPLDVNPGPKYMRMVISEDESNINPCGTYYYGETEDYKIYLVAPIAPEADFSANPLTVTAGMSIDFTDESLNFPSSWEWTITPGTEGVDYTFIEETSNTSQNPVVRFDVAEVYTIALTATNSVDSDTETKEDYITIEAVTTVPDADFEADITSSVNGEVVNFTDFSTQSPNAWAWTITPGTEGVDFEYIDGKNSTSQNPSVQFNTPEIYTIQLIATNVIGESEPEIKVDYIEIVGQYVMSNEIYTTCSGTFYDDGGPEGQYSNDLDFTMTFMPAEDEKAVQIEFFGDFQIESCTYDHLTVYDGIDASATEIAQFCGTTEPTEPIVATNVDGALTFVFHSDGSVTFGGWSANVTCTELIINVDEFNSNEISIYPNPTNGFFTVDLSSNYSKSTLIEIFSISGQKIYSENANQNIMTIDMSNNSKGIYFIKITNQDIFYYEKIILK